MNTVSRYLGATLTVTLDRGDHKPITVVVPIDCDKALEPIELSNDAFTLFLTGPRSKGRYVTYRRETLVLREHVAEQLGRQVTSIFMELVKKNDTIDSYLIEDTKEHPRVF